MTIAVVLVTALAVLGTRRARAGAAALAIGRRDELRVRRQHGRDQCRARGDGSISPSSSRLFMFVLLGNLLGLVPYSFTFTGQIIVTFALAATVFIGVTIIGIVAARLPFPAPLRAGRRARRCCSCCWCRSSSCPIASGPFTLAIRLFANMLAGHTMLAIFAGFAASVPLFGILPLGVDVLLYLPRASGRRAAGLCLRHPHLPLSARRPPSPLRRAHPLHPQHQGTESWISLPPR